MCVPLRIRNSSNFLVCTVVYRMERIRNSSKCLSLYNSLQNEADNGISMNSGTVAISRPVCVPKIKSPMFFMSWMVWWSFVLGGWGRVLVQFVPSCRWDYFSFRHYSNLYYSPDFRWNGSHFPCPSLHPRECSSPGKYGLPRLWRTSASISPKPFRPELARTVITEFHRTLSFQVILYFFICLPYSPFNWTGNMLEFSWYFSCYLPPVCRRGLSVSFNLLIQSLHPNP